MRDDHERPGMTGDEAAFRTLSLAAFDQDDPAASGVTVDLAVGTATVTADASGTVVGTVRNRTDEPLEIHVAGVGCVHAPLFSDPPGLALVDEGASDGWGRAGRPECWRPDRDRIPPSGADLSYLVGRLAPDEAGSFTLELLTDPGTDACLPPGPSDFEAVVGTDPPHEVRFTLRLAEP